MPEDELAEDFAAALRVAGIRIPAERHAIMLEAYRSHRALMQVLDAAMPMADEPAAAPRLQRAKA